MLGRVLRYRSPDHDEDKVYIVISEPFVAYSGYESTCMIMWDDGEIDWLPSKIIGNSDDEELCSPQ